MVVPDEATVEGRDVTCSVISVRGSEIHQHCVV